MYHIACAGVEEAIIGSSNFTVRGLGLAPAHNNIELNLLAPLRGPSAAPVGATPIATCDGF